MNNNGKPSSGNGNGSHGVTARLELEWASNPRWKGIKRPYSKKDVDQLCGTVHVEQTLAKMGADRLWKLLHTEEYVPALGAVTGNQAVQQVKAGLQAIFPGGFYC